MLWFSHGPGKRIGLMFLMKCASHFDRFREEIYVS